jgi:teichoic acid transport system ATP-binding protein
MTEASQNGKPVVIADSVHVEYKAHATGKGLKEGTRKILTPHKALRTVHALKGVTFKAYENESIGIIGSNGSGKSTLMRAIVGLTPTTRGAIYASSRPSMLGVGAALMPKLSGEKNIILGGLALGFTKAEMVQLKDEIVAFAELEQFIDLPMGTYSSGMQARLKFAIAASKQHDILIVDEALAVGDQRFRKRSEARIREMRENAGTVFLVSHSMKSIRDTCSRVLWIEKGELRMDGDPADVITEYQKLRNK